MTRDLYLLLALCLCAAACGARPPTTDPGDGGVDAGVADAGVDAGEPDVVPPSVSISAPTTGAVTGPDVAFDFSASESATFACSIDGAPVANCMPGIVITALATGLHSFSVVATDDAGNASFPASVAFNVNAPPTLADLTAIAFDEDQTSPEIPLVVVDSNTDVSTLTLRVETPNEALLPLTGLVLGGAGTSRSLVITPAPDQHGQTSVVITVSDGLAEVSRTLTVTVNPVNDRPTISDVGNQVVAEDGTTPPIELTVGDVETAAAALVVTAASSNTGLVPLSGITLAGTGPTRTVVLSPLANMSGSATITLTVSDGAATASDNFVLTVGGTNDAPTIAAIGAQSTAEDTVKSVTVDIADIDTALASLSLSASYNPAFVTSVTFTGTGASRTMNITPVANKTGTSNVTVTVSDGLGSAAATFALTLTPVNDAPVMSFLADRALPPDGDSGNVPFMVGDVDGDPLTVTSAVSGASNLGLTVTLGGSGGARTCLIAAAVNQGGTGQVTLTVSDGAGAMASRSITVTRKIRIVGLTSGPATGPVRVNGTGCTNTSTCDVMPGTGPITLAATNGAGGVIFNGWSGACAGQAGLVATLTAATSWQTCTARYVSVVP